MTTLANFRIQVAAKMGLDNSASSADRALMLLWINQGYEEVLARSRCYVATTTQTLTNGTADYQLSATILAVNDLYLTTAAPDSQVNKLTRVTAQEILDMRIATQNVGAPPVRYYALNGADLMLFPTPTAADIITFYYTPRPTALSGDSDEPSTIPAEWQKTLEYYMLCNAGQYVNDAASKNGDSYRAMYEDELAKLKKSLSKRGGRTLAPAVVGRRRWWPSSPGQDDGS